MRPRGFGEWLGFLFFFSVFGIGLRELYHDYIRAEIKSVTNCAPVNGGCTVIFDDASSKWVPFETEGDKPIEAR